MTAAKTFRGKVKSLGLDEIEFKLGGGEYTFEGWASRPVIDRYNEIVDVAAFEGTLETFARNPIMLWQHDARQPIGHYPKLHLSDQGLWVGGMIGEGWQAADDARAMVKAGVIRSLSIGFRETKRGVVDKSGVYHIVGLELLETSLVSIPANQEALFSMDQHGKLTNIELIDEDDTLFAPERLEALARKRGFVTVPEAIGQASPVQLAESLLERGLIRHYSIAEGDENGETLVIEGPYLGRLINQDESSGAKGVISYVKYPTLDPGTTWDAGKARASLRDAATSDPDGKPNSGDESIDFSKYRAGFAYFTDGQQDKLGGYKLPHHIAEGGIKTNLRGCRAVIGVLAGARGGVKLSDAEKRGVYDHVARHIKDDFNLNVPAFDDLGKLDEPELLKTLDLTLEELDSVKAEFETTDPDVVLEVLSVEGEEIDPAPVIEPSETETPKTETPETEIPETTPETEIDPTKSAGDPEPVVVALDFSTLDEAIALAARAAKTASDIETLRQDLEATTTTLSSLPDEVKDLTSRLENIEKSIGVLLDDFRRRLTAQVEHLAVHSQPHAA